MIYALFNSQDVDVFRVELELVLELAQRHVEGLVQDWRPTDPDLFHFASEGGQLLFNVLFIPPRRLFLRVDVFREPNRQFEVTELESFVDSLKALAQLQSNRLVYVLESDIQVELEVIPEPLKLRIDFVRSRVLGFENIS